MPDLPAPTAPAAASPTPGAMNALGIAGCVAGVAAVFCFNSATHTGKGGEVIPLAISLLAGVAAIVLSVVGWVRGRRRDAERVTCILAATLGGLALSFLFFAWPATARQRTNRQPCPSNLNHIGMALLLYSRSHGGRLPDRLADLTAGPDALPADALACPDGGDSPPHVSYDYLGAGRLYDDFGPDDIVAFEPPHNHDSDGGYALFGDGHIQFVHPAVRLREEVARARAMLTTRPAATQPASRGSLNAPNAAP